MLFQFLTFAHMDPYLTDHKLYPVKIFLVWADGLLAGEMLVQVNLMFTHCTLCPSRLWTSLKKLDTSTSQTLLLISTFVPWTEVQWENSRVTLTPLDCPEALSSWLLDLCLHSDFWFFFFSFSWINSDFWCNAKSPLWLGPVAACPACRLEWAPWMKRWPRYRHQSRVSRGWALSIRRSPRKPWKRHLIYRKEVGRGNLVALNECAYCYHVCFLISCSLWQMHGQHCLTTL